MKTIFLILLFAFSLLFPVNLISAAEVTGTYELDEPLCLGGSGMVWNENCVRIRPSPYAQQQDGIEPEKVRCNHDLYRSYKISDGTAFCASGYTLRELIHREYAESFDSLTSATVSGQNNTVSEYCPASQELVQSGWYAYEHPTDVILTNIDLVFSAKENSYGVEYSFDKPTDGKSMIWVFVECDSSFDTFEIVILPETIQHRKNFVVNYPEKQNTAIHFVNQDSVPYKIEGMPDTGVGTGDFTVLLDPEDDWLVGNEYDGVESISLSAANPDTGESYDWMNYIIYITEFGERR